jgi:Fe-S cluster biogenesis protein NfuA
MGSIVEFGMSEPAALDLKAKVARILATEVEPILQLSSGVMEVLDVTDGIVRLRLGDACASCPSSVTLVVMELEQELRKRIPEIEYLEAVP